MEATRPMIVIGSGGRQILTPAQYSLWRAARARAREARRARLREALDLRLPEMVRVRMAAARERVAQLVAARNAGQGSRRVAAMPRRVVPATPVDAARVIEVRRRFEICRNCQDGLEFGARCRWHKGCCFGRWRATLEKHCPHGKW